MKLRNKRTGDIWEFDGGFSMKATQETAEKAGAESGSLTCFESSIAELNEKWEDYEEPKEVWYIDFQGVVRSASKEENDWFKENEIGNCFYSKEEAEKAVEKLKAWKRLKEAGVRFDECRPEYQKFEIYYVMPERPVKEYDQIFADIYLLFGGEE